jgi:hypothetical protein
MHEGYTRSSNAAAPQLRPNMCDDCMIIITCCTSSYIKEQCRKTQAGSCCLRLTWTLHRPLITGRQRGLPLTAHVEAAAETVALQHQQFVCFNIISQGFKPTSFQTYHLSNLSHSSSRCLRLSPLLRLLLLLLPLPPQSTSIFSDSCCCCRNRCSRRPKTSSTRRLLDPPGGKPRLLTPNRRSNSSASCALTCSSVPLSVVYTMSCRPMTRVLPSLRALADLAARSGSPLCSNETACREAVHRASRQFHVRGCVNCGACGRSLRPEQCKQHVVLQTNE